MTVLQLEKRLEALERTVQTLQASSTPPPSNGKWWLERAGMFADDPVYAEIVRRGAAYRKSLRPKAGKQKR